MVAEDIGRIIFVELLQMTEYPGSPFTGDIVRDLIMFLLVPTVFIILVVYMMLGRVLPPGAYPRMRLLLGITTYLFIIAGGYYRAFALLAGPYFLVLVFVLGILFFFLEHFRRGGPGGRDRETAAPPAAGGYPASAYASGIAHYENMSRRDLNIAKQRAEASIRSLDREIREAQEAQAKGKGIEVATRLEDLRGRRAALNDELREINTQLNLLKKWRREMPF